MTFTPQGPSFGPPTQPATGGGTKNLVSILLIAVAALGLITFLLGFAPYSSISATGLGSDIDTSSSFFESGVYGLGFIFAGGVVAGLCLLPKQAYVGIAAALSLTGFLSLVFATFALGSNDFVDIGGGLYFVLVLSFLQTVAAVGALLLNIGILKAPAPRPAPAAPQQFGQPQGYGQGQYGRPQQQPGQQYGQPAQYGQAPQQGFAGTHPGSADQAAAQQQPQQYGQNPSGYGQNVPPNPAAGYPDSTDTGSAQHYGGYTAPSAPQAPTYSAQQQIPSYSSDHFTAPRGYGQPYNQQTPAAEPSGWEAPAPVSEPEQPAESATETRAFDSQNPNERQQ